MLSLVKKLFAKKRPAQSIFREILLAYDSLEMVAYANGIVLTQEAVINCDPSDYRCKEVRDAAMKLRKLQKEFIRTVIEEAQ